MLASALAGNTSSLQRVTTEIDLKTVFYHRVGPALAVQAQRANLAGPYVKALKRKLYESVAYWAFIEVQLRQLSQIFEEAGVVWIPLKGADLGTRVYDYPAERPVSDLDILISEKDYPKARMALERNGWGSFYPGARSDRFILEEGHNWPAISSANILLELHIRLWGLTPTRLPADLLEAAFVDSSLGPGCHRVPLAHAFIIAAVHSWLNRPPRRLLSWLDLIRITAVSDSSLITEVVSLARRWELQLPVALAAANASALWDDLQCHEIAEALLGDLSIFERLTVGLTERRGFDALSLEALSLARLVSLRSSRAGLGLIYRRIWPHSGVVEQQTPGSQPWLVRRTFYTLKSISSSIRAFLP